MFIRTNSLLRSAPPSPQECRHIQQGGGPVGPLTERRNPWTSQRFLMIWIEPTSEKLSRFILKNLQLWLKVLIL